MQCYSSSSIPAAMVYFAAYDHKKRLHSSLSCAWCSHLNLLDWAQTWIKAAVVQVHTPTLEPGSGHVCISWVTPSSCQPFLPGHLLTAPWPSHHHASRSISTAVHWSSTGICAGSNQENRRLMLAWDFFLNQVSSPHGSHAELRRHRWHSHGSRGSSTATDCQIAARGAVSCSSKKCVQ